MQLNNDQVKKILKAIPLVIFQAVIGQEEIKLFNVLLIRGNKKVKKVFKIKLEQQISPLKIIKRNLKIIKINLLMIKMSL